MKDKFTFEKKIVRAALFSKEGDPIEDVLDESEIIEAIERLADVYVALNIVKVSEVS